MKTTKIALTVLFLTVAVSLIAAETETSEYVPGELIVKFEDGIIDVPDFEETPVAGVSILDSQFVQPMLELGVQSVEHVFKEIFARAPFRFTTKNGREVQLEDLSQVYLLRMNESLDMEQVAAEVELLPGVIYAEPNYLFTHCTEFPNDLDFGYEPGDGPEHYQWGLHNEHVTTGWDINALKAWSVETGDRDVLLAILDSGLETDHYDAAGDEFYGRVTHTHDWTGKGLDDEWFFIRSTWTERARGTHVAGVAAAATNTSAGQGGEHGIAGVAGGWSNEKGVELAIGKITHKDEWPSSSDIATAIEWATGQGAQVVNCSYVTGGHPQALKDAVENALTADMALFFPTGNAFDEEGRFISAEGEDIGYPAKYAGFNLCSAVGAMDDNGGREYYSFYGPQISFVAPGEWIASTNNGAGDYYSSVRGTSYASPFAAGVGALLYSTEPDLTDIDCIRIMENTARHNDQLYGTAPDTFTGYGCVDAWEGLRHLYWPYTLEHKTVAHSQLQKTELGYGKVQFVSDQTGQIAAGTYFCDKYRFTGSVSFSSNFEETPWFWERILSEPVGYTATGDGAITGGIFGLTNTTVNASGASFQTYTYYVKYDVAGRWVGKWVPYDTADIAVAITALGQTATKTTHSTPVVSSNYGLGSDLVVDWYHSDVPNAVHISYYDVANGDLRYIIDDFSGFSSNEIVDSEGNVGDFPSIALDYEGKPHIAYYDVTDHFPRHAYKNSSGSWVIEPVWHQEGSSLAAVYQTSIAVGEVPGLATGLVHICGYLYNASPMPAPFNGYDLLYGYRDGSGPYGWSIEAVDVEGDVGDYCSIAVDANNIPHISYYDATNTSLKYAVRTGTNTWLTTTVDNSASVGKFSSIAIDKLGGIHISYYDATNDALKYAYKSSSGVTWQVETAYEYLGAGTSICIDDDGRPVIVFGSDSYVGCVKKMAAGWEIQNVDGNGNADYGTSVGIDNLGRMVTSYYGNNKLYVTRRMRWPQETGYGSALQQPNEGIEEDMVSPDPTAISVTSNPTYGSTIIKYTLTCVANVNIAVYDVTGRKVITLRSGDESAGAHELLWEGEDFNGHTLSRGVYIIHMEIGDYQVNEKVTLLR